MPAPFHRSICWIRRDLRLLDNTTLCRATEASAYTALLFVFDRNILEGLPKEDRRLTFIYQSLTEVDRKLRAKGSALIVRYGDPVEEVPAVAREFGAQAVFAGRDYEPYAAERDETVRRRLAESDCELHLIKDAVVFEAGELLTQTGQPYRNHAPYGRAWRTRFTEQACSEHRPRLERLAPIDHLPKGSALCHFTLERLGFEESELWLAPGEDGAIDRLCHFVAEMDDYARKRDQPAVDGTSGLSVHLRFGTVSIRACLRAALDAGPSSDKWISELIWRDFFQDVIAHHPRIAGEPFDERYAGLRSPGDPGHFEAWRQGQTGYPLVDAAMRCLNATGWMPNRLRMVAASFLCKDLLLDYRLGEQYFARQLLDYDLASNVGNWQWVASAGAEAQPWFRVMNPTSQSERHDPDGEFIRKWVPELEGLSAPSIHSPAEAPEMELIAAGVELGVTYPRPVVDHKVQRERAIQMFR